MAKCMAPGRRAVRLAASGAIALAVATAPQAALANDDRVMKQLHVALNGCVRIIATGAAPSFPGFTSSGGRSWRDLGGALEVKLVEGSTPAGVCRVAYRPSSLSRSLVGKLDAYGAKIEAAMMAHPRAEVDVANVGRVVVTCVANSALGLFFDERVRGQGFAMQISPAPPGRISCGG